MLKVTIVVHQKYCQYVPFVFSFFFFHDYGQPRSQGLSSSRPLERSRGREEERPWERGWTTDGQGGNGLQIENVGPTFSNSTHRMCVTKIANTDQLWSNLPSRIHFTPSSQLV